MLLPVSSFSEPNQEMRFRRNSPLRQLSGPPCGWRAVQRSSYYRSRGGYVRPRFRLHRPQRPRPLPNNPPCPLCVVPGLLSSRCPAPVSALHLNTKPYPGSRSAGPSACSARRLGDDPLGWEASHLKSVTANRVEPTRKRASSAIDESLDRWRGGAAMTMASSPELAAETGGCWLK